MRKLPRYISISSWWNIMMGLFGCTYCKSTHGSKSMNIHHPVPEPISLEYVSTRGGRSLSTHLASFRVHEMTERVATRKPSSPSSVLSCPREVFYWRFYVSIDPSSLKHFIFRFNVGSGGLYSEKSYFWWSKKGASTFLVVYVSLEPCLRFSVLS